LALKGGPLPGGVAGGGALTRSRSESREPASSSLTVLAPVAPSQGGLSEQFLGVCGRPSGGPMVSGKGLGPQEKEREGKPSAPAAEKESLAGRLLTSLGLQVSGLPVSALPAAPTEAAEPIDWEAKDWSSSDEDEEVLSAGSEGDDAAFNYREYRYRRSQEARTRAAAPELHRRGRQQRRPRHSSQARDASSESGCSSPWARGESPPRWTAETAVPSACSSSLAGPLSRESTPFCEEEPPDDELCLVGEVLVKFYGLPGGRECALRLKNNLIIVRDEAWAGRKRASQFTEPPLIWVRGGRVYDFHGDRGTIAEFSNDLLMRQVEDDAICRMRRRDQGLMPYPFVAAPLKRDEDAEEQVDAPRDGGAGNPGRNLGKRGHWL